MFIIKLGEEALNRLEKQLSKSKDQCQATTKSSQPCSYESNPESSILYNLLTCEDGSSTKPKSLLIPEYSKFDSNHPRRANTVSYSKPTPLKRFNLCPRPNSAPQTYTDISDKKNHKRIRTNAILDDCGPCESDHFAQGYKVSSKGSSSPVISSSSLSHSTDSLCDEPMDFSKAKHIFCKSVEHNCLVDSWLFKTVLLINTTNKQYNTNLTELPPKIRLHLLHSSWHRIFITYLFEYLKNSSSNLSSEITKFVMGTSSQWILGKRNLSYMLKNLVNELNIIFFQIQNLNIDDAAMNYLRIGLFLTGDQEENNNKNLRLVELFIQSKIEGSGADLRIIRDLIKDLLKLNPVVIETLFFGHLGDSVEKIMERLFTNS